MILFVRGGMGVTIHVFKRLIFQQITIAYIVHSSALTYSIQCSIILPNLPDQKFHLGALVNNIDPEFYPKIFFWIVWEFVFLCLLLNTPWSGRFKK